MGPVRRKRWGRGHFSGSFRKNTWAVEGFITELPALAIIIFAITAFMITSVSAYGMYMEDRARVKAVDRAQDISLTLRGHPSLIIDGRTDHISASALDSVEKGALDLDLKNTGDMWVSIWELDHGQRCAWQRGSMYLEVCPPQWHFGNTNRSDAPLAVHTHVVLVGHDPPGEDDLQYYLARLEVRTW